MRPFFLILLLAAASPAEIDKLAKAGKIDDAIAQGRAAAAERPEDAETRMALARALATKSRRFNHVVNVKVSEEDLKKGEVKIPGANLGDSPLRPGYDASLFEEAQINLDAAIAAAPKRVDARALKCFLLTDAGRIDRAKAAIVDALAALPESRETATTLIAFGAERAKKDDLEGGAQLMAPVAAAFPGLPEIQSDYGNLLTRLGRKREADAAFDRAIAAAPNDERTARTRAVAAMLLRDYPRARGAFDALFRAKRSPNDQFASAAAAYGVDPKAAIDVMRSLSAPAAGADKAMSDLANLYALAGTAGAGSEAAMSLGRKLVASQQLVIAIPVLDRAAAANPKNAEAKKLLAQVYRDLGAPGLAK